MTPASVRINLQLPKDSGPGAHGFGAVRRPTGQRAPETSEASSCCRTARPLEDARPRLHARGMVLWWTSSFFRVARNGSAAALSQRCPISIMLHSVPCHDSSHLWCALAYGLRRPECANSPSPGRRALAAMSSASPVWQPCITRSPAPARLPALRPLDVRRAEPRQATLGGPQANNGHV